MMHYKLLSDPQCFGATSICIYVYTCICDMYFVCICVWEYKDLDRKLFPASLLHLTENNLEVEGCFFPASVSLRNTV